MKKWKSLFACGLVLLLTGWTMLCIPFNAYAQTWEAESTSTNIVAVVDCSTSMQSSDSDWKIPESLDMLRKSTIKFYKNSERFLFILKQYK